MFLEPRFNTHMDDSKIIEGTVTCVSLNHASKTKQMY